jgi:hypothetical protein
MPGGEAGAGGVRGDRSVGRRGKEASLSQGFDVGPFDDRGERVATELPAATQSQPRLLISGGHDRFLFAEELAGS